MLHISSLFAILATTSFIVAAIATDESLCKSPCAHTQHGLGARSDANCYDFMLFQLTWPASLCAFHSGTCGPLQGKFTIHGLWPNRCDDTWPQFCGGTSFDESKIEDLIQELNTIWPDLFAGPGSTGTEFWKHEYDKHGTCCTDVFSDEHSYFAAAIQLAQTYRPSEALEAHGITASDSVTYDANEVRRAIASRLGVQPLITCTFDVELNADIVASLTLCVDKFSMQAKSCPDALHHVDTCRGQIYLPATADRLSYRDRFVQK